MKKCSKSSVIKEMQIKTKMRHYYTPIRIVKIKNTDNTKCWQGCGGTGFLILIYTFTTQSNNHTPEHLSSRNENLCSHKNLCVFTAALFVIDKTGERKNPTALW